MFDVSVGVVGVGGVGAHHVEVLKRICRFVGIYDIKEGLRRTIS